MDDYMNLRVEDPLLSIIVTAHNCEEYLEKCLQSIVKSTGKIFYLCQIILIDDTSKDRTTEICHSFSQAYANVEFYQVNFTNIGKVRNFALEQCKGQYVTMIDGDDEVTSDAFSDIYSVLIKQKPDIYLTRLNEIYPTTKINVQWQGEKYVQMTRHKAITKFLIHRNIKAHFIGQFICRDILTGMRFPEYSCYEDLYLFPFILAKSSKIIYSHDGPYLYFKRNNSLSSNITPEKVSLYIKAVEQMHKAFGDKYNNLIACHWIKIQDRYQTDINNTNDKNCISTNLKKIPFISFLLDPKIRLSFKRKYIKILLTSKI